MSVSVSNVAVLLGTHKYKSVNDKKPSRLVTQFIVKQLRKTKSFVRITNSLKASEKDISRCVERVKKLCTMNNLDFQLFAMLPAQQRGIAIEPLILERYERFLNVTCTPCETFMRYWRDGFYKRAPGLRITGRPDAMCEGRVIEFKNRTRYGISEAERIQLAIYCMVLKTPGEFAECMQGRIKRTPMSYQSACIIADDAMRRLSVLTPHITTKPT